jgi:predicted Zn-dependent protease with MMP-like domain
MASQGTENVNFEQLVADAIDSLPEDLGNAMQNVEIVVEEEPPRSYLQKMPRGYTLFGLYHGVPLTDRGIYDRALPDKISIYKGPIVRRMRTPDAIKEQVRRTVIHEIAHHFGIDDDRLHELGWG